MMDALFFQVATYYLAYHQLTRAWLKVRTEVAYHQ